MMDVNLLVGLSCFVMGILIGLAFSKWVYSKNLENYIVLVSFLILILSITYFIFGMDYLIVTGLVVGIILIIDIVVSKLKKKNKRYTPQEVSVDIGENTLKIKYEGEG